MVTAIWSFFFVYYNCHPLNFLLAFWIFNYFYVKEQYMFLRWLFLPFYLFFFFDGLEAEKQNVGLSRTDSRHAAEEEKIFTTRCFLSLSRLI